jgi:hypothetical protein
MSQPTPAAPPAPEPEKPKTILERVITATPIVLTVIATVLAGMSSGEMTRAQYYRALAAQQQSKVSDQWNFFQAKKIRGTDMTGTVTVLHAVTEPREMNRKALTRALDRLPALLLKTGPKADDLEKAVAAAGTDLGDERERVTAAAGEVKASAADVTKRAEALRSQLTAEWARAAKEDEGSLGHLGTNTLPVPAQNTSPPREVLDNACREINPRLLDALADIAARKTERDMKGVLKDITEEQVEKAIDKCESLAAEWEKSSDPTTAHFRRLEKLVGDYAALARGYDAAVGDFEATLAAVPSGNAKALTDLRLEAAAVTRGARDLRRAADELSVNYKAAHLDYTVRRYDRESNFNQYIAGLYEVDVRKQSLLSERHRQRSMNFFNAMLAAQAGVTIATFSLAMRYRSALWGLAALAGAAALAFAGYIYLTM